MSYDVVIIDYVFILIYLHKLYLFYVLNSILDLTLEI